MSTSYKTLQESKNTVSTMKALVFRGPNRIGIEELPIPRPASGEVVIRITLTTICGTDLHILKGEYSVKPGLIIGHEPVGVIHEIGPGRRLSSGRPRARWRDYPLRSVQLLPERELVTMRRRDWWVEVRKHHP